MWVSVPHIPPQPGWFCKRLESIADKAQLSDVSSLLEFAWSKFFDNFKLLGAVNESQLVVRGPCNFHPFAAVPDDLQSVPTDLEPDDLLCKETSKLLCYWIRPSGEFRSRMLVLFCLFNIHLGVVFSLCTCCNFVVVCAERFQSSLPRYVALRHFSCCLNSTAALC